LATGCQSGGVAEQTASQVAQAGSGSESEEVVVLASSSRAETAAEPKRLRLSVVDDRGEPVVSTFIRVEECCGTQRGPCGRVPLDERGQATIDVCPRDGRVHVLLTPDARLYRVAPVREYEVEVNTSVTLTVTRHESALRRLKQRADQEVDRKASSLD
jgi:hypothetical protein